MKWIFTILLALVTSNLSYAQQSIDLSGEWSARIINAQDSHRESLIRPCFLPGSNLTNHLGSDPALDTKWTGSLYDSSFYFNPYMAKYRQKGHIKFPFFLTPNKHYVGHIVYSRSLTVPNSWKNQRVILYLERPHIETTVEVNGIEVGHQMSLSTPHIYDITKAVKYGTDNKISIDVYNGIENVCVGQDSHSVTDQTQGNWNGIVGEIKLIRLPLRAYKAETILNPKVQADYQSGEVAVVFPDTTIRYHIDNPQRWSEFNPVVYHQTVDYKGIKVPVSFGFRKIAIKGRQFYLNDKPIWIRGTVENCNFPLTGYPPMDVKSWMKVFRKCREFGLNAMRFHSYCPPEAAFVAADSLGFYLQPEGPSWPNHGVKLRRGQKVDQYLAEETKRIVDTYGNHPSFVMMALGNEPAGDWVSYCNDWVDSMKVYDSRRVYCGASVGGGWAWDSHSQYHVKGGARGLDWDKKAPQSNDDYYEGIIHPRNFKPSAADASLPAGERSGENTSPVIAHEQGQWCAFPDLKERSQYTGVYKAYNFDIFADILNEHGMGSMAEKFLMSSGKLQTLCYKYEMERNLRTKDYAGFLLLGLNDYSGQGTALVGPLNVFWKEKGYIRGNDWRRFCNEVVVMAEFPKFTFESGEKASVPVDFYNATFKAYDTVRVTYCITRQTVMGKKSSSHQLVSSMPVGKTRHVFDIPLETNVEKPGKFILTINIMADGRPYTNTYDYWVYPTRERDVHSILKGKEKGIYITDTLDARAIEVLRKGGKVLIAAAGKVRYGNDVKQTYLPVFWNTSWFKMRPPHTTGSYIDSKHPLFKEFPTDDWSNLNWWELINKAQVMNLAEFPKTYQSPIQPIDTWHISRKLGMLVEAKVMKGKLLMTTMDIINHLDERIVARQMRKAILDYMDSKAFNPSLTLDARIISDLFEKTAPAVDMFTKDSPDELKPKLK